MRDFEQFDIQSTKIFLGFIPHGPMDKASAYGAEDSRFDPWCGSPIFCENYLVLYGCIYATQTFTKRKYLDSIASLSGKRLEGKKSMAESFLDAHR